MYCLKQSSCSVVDMLMIYRYVLLLLVLINCKLYIYLQDCLLVKFMQRSDVGEYGCCVWIGLGCLTPLRVREKKTCEDNSVVRISNFQYPFDMLYLLLRSHMYIST